MIHVDNQQERPFDSLAWLAGIIDGEGHIGMSKQKYKEYIRYTPRVCIVNTDVALLDAVGTILKENNIGFHVSTRQRNERSKPTFDFTTSGIKRLAKLLPLLVNRLRGKKERAAKILNEYVQTRMSMPYKSGAGFDKDKAESVYLQLKEINQTGILRDFTPVVLQVDGDKVRTAWRHAESAPTKDCW